MALIFHGASFATATAGAFALFFVANSEKDHSGHGRYHYA
jgi:hypothetical protein